MSLSVLNALLELLPPPPYEPSGRLRDSESQRNPARTPAAWLGVCVCAHTPTHSLAVSRRLGGEIGGAAAEKRLSVCEDVRRLVLLDQSTDLT